MGEAGYFLPATHLIQQRKLSGDSARDLTQGRRQARSREAGAGITGHRRCKGYAFASLPCEVVSLAMGGGERYIVMLTHGSVS